MANPSKSRRPYLIRAIYQWTLDNGFTPYLLVAADQPGVTVPTQFVKDGRIALDIGGMAVRELNIENDPIFFSARFGGRPYDIVVPSGAVLAIYARENGEGMAFEVTESPEAADGAAPDAVTEPDSAAVSPAPTFSAPLISRPENFFSTPSTCTCTGRPGASRPTSCVPTLPASSMSRCSFWRVLTHSRNRSYSSTQ